MSIHPTRPRSTRSGNPTDLETGSARPELERASLSPSYRVAVMGAGPYGLSVAAHLRSLGIPHIVLGRPMDSWRDHMPEGMFLKSPWGSGSSLSEPSGYYTLDRFIRDRGGRPPGQPIPIQDFVDYCQWFRTHNVPDIDETFVSRLAKTSTGFRLDLVDGREISAERVVIATGIGHTLRVPEFAAGLPASLVSHSFDHHSAAGFAGRQVLVIGAGQSGLEWSALLTEAGAEVELLVRASKISWIHYKFWSRGLGKRILYAPSDVGPVGLSWLIAKARLLRYFPFGLKARITARAVHPAGAKWLRARVEGRIKTTLGVSVRSAAPTGSRLHVELSDGSYRGVDHLLLATGFRPQLARLPYLDPGLLANVATTGGMPDLNRYFESSVPGLHFAGAITSGSFGPLTRFVAGAAVNAKQIAKASRLSRRK